MQRVSHFIETANPVVASSTEPGADPQFTGVKDESLRKLGVVFSGDAEDFGPGEPNVL
jgi:hypothetical protein